MDSAIPIDTSHARDSLESIDAGGIASDTAPSSSDDVFECDSSRCSSPPTSHHSGEEVKPTKGRRMRDVLGEPESQSLVRLRSRPSFRKPSAVRAMQTDVTPPRLSAPSQPWSGRHETVRRREISSRTSPSKRSDTSSSASPSKNMRKEYPLVLLHITLLPTPLHYSQEVLESVLSPDELARWRRLQDRATPTVLQRGVLVSHPREDFDLLRERLLEALELRPPRILKCGHFHLTPDEETDVLDLEDSEHGPYCDDCGNRIREVDPETSQTSRWTVKIYAANGLMRASAWSAAWRDMERVDAEVVPGMTLETRRRLDEAQRAMKDEEHGIAGLDDARLREIYGQDIDYTNAKSEEVVSSSRPLSELLQFYMGHVIKDWRNLLITALSMFVLYFALGPKTTSSQNLQVSATTSVASMPPPLAPAIITSKEMALTVNEHDAVPALVPDKEMALTVNANDAVPALVPGKEMA